MYVVQRSDYRGRGRKREGRQIVRREGEKEKEGGEETFKYMNDGDATGVGQVHSQPPSQFPPMEGMTFTTTYQAPSPTSPNLRLIYPVGQRKLFFQIADWELAQEQRSRLLLVTYYCMVSVRNAW